MRLRRNGRPRAALSLPALLLALALLAGCGARAEVRVVTPTPQPSATLAARPEVPAASATPAPTATPLPVTAAAAPTQPLTPAQQPTSPAQQAPAATPSPPSTAVQPQAAAPPPAAAAAGRQAPEPGLRVAFFGDQGRGANARAVLELVKREGASMVLHLGDFDYDDDPAAFESQINAVLGPDFPYFAVIGNHDVDRWAQYQQGLIQRLQRIPGAACEGDYGVKAACTYRGLFFILSGAGTRGSGHAAFIADQLARNDAVWSVCAWHKNQTAMQVGGKDNDVGWEPYEECRKGGAIVATGHEHSYSRTRTLSSLQGQTVDQAWSDPANLRVGGGSTFVFVSGLGGNSIRDQERCMPASPPYGCKGEWASIYTTNQGARPGALFIDFNVDGDPRKAHAYFKNINGQVIDSFTITTE